MQGNPWNLLNHTREPDLLQAVGCVVLPSEKCNYMGFYFFKYFGFDHCILFGVPFEWRVGREEETENSEGLYGNWCLVFPIS